MKESMWGYWIIVLGIAVFAIMMVLQNYSVTDEQSFFLAKENLASSMKEAVDYAYFTDASPTITEDNYKNSNEIYGRFKINREKLVENFIRRFADTVDISKTYTINFYYISEIPPAASVEVLSSTGKTNFGSTQNAASEEISTSSRFTGILFTTEEYTPGFNTAG
ncbi:MAG: DUF5411 family protein [Bacilli bacterium]|nr:DUF5411 family protein [Bacilli bacterium]